MGHKPWDRAWKRVEKMRARRQWKREEAESLAELEAGESVSFTGPGWADRAVAWLLEDEDDRDA